MSFEHWFAFAAASAVLLAIPGPTILLVISYALGHGRKIAGATVAGVALGDFTAMTASMLGLGALLATSAAVFTVLKWIGAAYLVWLGIKLWKAPVESDTGSLRKSPVERPSRIFIIPMRSPRSIRKAFSSSSLSCPSSSICLGRFSPRWPSSRRPSWYSRQSTRRSTPGLPPRPAAPSAGPVFGASLTASAVRCLSAPAC